MNISKYFPNNEIEAVYLEKIKPLLYSHRTLVFALVIALLTTIGCIRIILTYNVFWQTWDEPFHVAAGLEWLDKGMYTYEPYHPPLARVMMAIGPYLNGVRIVAGESTLPPIVYQGNRILYADGEYEQNLTLARIGILPFFILASIIVALWGKLYGGTLVALLATLLFTTLPPILAHSGFATLDMACAALVATTLYSLTLWLKKPALLHSIFLGIVLGLATLSKLQALGFLIVGACLTIALYSFDLYRRKKLSESVDVPQFRQLFSSIAILLLMCTLIIWAGYRFSVGYLLKYEDRPHEKVDRIVGSQGVFHNIAYFILEDVPIPAPELKVGVQDFFIKNNQGHLDYFLGDIREYGWWYYFPLILILKTPLPFILLCAIGFFFVFWNVFWIKRESISLLIPVVSSLGFLAVSTIGKHNNGIRQILSIFPLLAIVAGYGGWMLISQRKKFYHLVVGFVAILVSWQLISSFASHPNYLVYFNEFAENHPETIAVDSDLDWGQDLKRLSLTLKERDINAVKIKYHGSAGMDLTLFNLPPLQELIPYQRESGWVAISIYSLTLGTGQSPFDQFSWLRKYEPVEKIGGSIWLYYIPDE